MADYNARVLPFINTVAYVTAKAGEYPGGGYHSGIDLATSGNDPLYAMCDSEIVEKGYQASGYGNYVVYKDLTSDYAFLYGHMRDPCAFNVGDRVALNQQIGIEGATGNVTGIHVHIEMQNYVQNGNQWIHRGQDPSAWRYYIFASNRLYGISK